MTVQRPMGTILQLRSLTISKKQICPFTNILQCGGILAVPQLWSQAKIKKDPAWYPDLFVFIV
jgi:hypothetical protein